MVLVYSFVQYSLLSKVVCVIDSHFLEVTVYAEMVLRMLLNCYVSDVSECITVIVCASLTFCSVSSPTYFSARCNHAGL